MANGKLKRKSKEHHYNYAAAIKAGYGPGKSKHWPSRVSSGPDEGLILKNPKHPTFWKTAEGERKAGMVWVRRKGKLYTFPKGDKRLR